MIMKRMKKRNKHKIPIILLAFVLAATMLTPGLAPRVGAYDPAGFESDFVITGVKAITVGGTYLIQNQTLTANSSSGIIRVETSDPVTLIFDGTNSLTTTGSGLYGPLVIGTVTDGTATTGQVPTIRANVTIILAAGSNNKFECTSTATSSQAKSAGIAVCLGSKLTIMSEDELTNPGSLHAIGGYYAAGIGTGANKHTGTIVIESGIIKAESNSSGAVNGMANNGPGIGGGGANTHPGGTAEAIIIRGSAHVTATAYGEGAGIGGGAGGNTSFNGLIGPGNGGYVEIYGNATVVASSAGKGAGIGGGGRTTAAGSLDVVFGGAGGSIHIYDNANVTATSYGGGAGIGGAGALGGATAGAGGTVLIEHNAVVIANSEGTGAGIGGGGTARNGATLATGNAGAGGSITIKDNAVVTATSGGKGAGIGGGGTLDSGNAGASGFITISGMAVVTGTSTGCGAGIGGGGTDPRSTPNAAAAPIPGRVDKIHIFGGDEKGPIETATLGPTVTTSSQDGTDLGAGRQGENGPKGSGDEIVITSGNVRAWDSDVVRSDTVFSNNTRLVMAQARNRTPGEVVIWPINAETYGDVPGIGEYNYIAWPMKDLDFPGEWVAYLWVPYAYMVDYLPGAAKDDPTTTGTMPIDYGYLVYNDIATVINPNVVNTQLNQNPFKWPGYRFTGWRDNVSGIFYQPGDTFYVKRNVELVAQWEDAYTVTYDAGGAAGEAPVDSFEYVNGEAATIMGQGGLNLLGQYFVGWKSNIAGEENKIYQAGNTIAITNTNIVMTAQWATNIYTVSYATDGEENSGSVPAPVDYAYGVTVTVAGNTNASPLVRSGYVVYGWEDNDGSIYTPGDTFVVEEDTILTVVWGHSVTYVGGTVNSGTPPIDSDSPYQGGETVTVLGLGTVRPLDKVGYTFEGWTDGSNTYVPEDISTGTFDITGNTTLTAIWEPIKYTVTYLAGGAASGTVPPNSPQYEYGQMVLAPGNTGSLEKAEYEFIGWTPDGGATVYRPGVYFPMTEDTEELTAVWRKFHMVAFESNGGSSVGAARVADQGRVPKPLDPTRAGYVFDGWFTNSGLTNAWIVDTFVVDDDKTLYAKWTAETYRVTYARGEATAGPIPTDSTLYPYDSTVTVRANTITQPTGKSFSGWFDGKSNIYMPGSGSDTFQIKENTTLTAIWGNVYTVNFDINGGESGAIVSQTVPEYERVSAPTPPTRAGYTFDNWHTQDGTGGQWGMQWNFTAFQVDATYATGGALTLYARWIPVGYTVSFDSNGGDAVGDIAANYGDTIAEPTAPTRTGYTFVGWFKDDGTFADEWIFTTSAVDGNRTLYAKWTAIEYTVSFESNGGSTVLPIDGDFGTIITAPTAPTRTGYTFVGWFEDDGTFADEWVFATSTVDGNRTLYAKWTATEYTVSFDSNGGDIVGDIPANYGATITAPTAPTKTGYTFVGWFKDDGTFSDEWIFTTSAVDGNRTLYAKWNAIEYTVSYDGDDSDGGVVPTDSAQYNVGNTVTIATGTPTKTGYTFGGWLVTTPSSGVTISGNTFTMPAENVTLTAQWTPVGATMYTVTYEPNTGSGTAPTETDKAENGTFSAAANTFSPPAGKQFKEWNTQAGGGGTSYAAGDPITMPASNLTLFAIWEDVPVPTSFTLTIQAGVGGSVDTSVNGSYATGVSIPIVATGDSDYVFTLWTSDNGGTFADNSAASTTFDMPAANVVITAHFTYTGGGGGSGSTDDDDDGDAIVYTVTYNANGGRGSYAVMGYIEGRAHRVYTRSSTGINYTGYIFDGWNTEADGSGIAYSAGDNLIISDNVHLYAQWIQIERPLEKDNHISYLRGYPDNTVRPDNSITRAEVSAIFFRLLADSNKYRSISQKFEDVPDGQWYTQYVNYLTYVGVLTGYPDGTFRPDEPITRAEFVAVVSRFHNPLFMSTMSFPDVSSSHWAYREICMTYTRGWINGYPDGTFRPDQFITRAEAAKIVNIQLERMIDSEALASVVNPYDDIVSTHWGYADIIEASFEHEYTSDAHGGEVWLTW